jgi:hypothetical protein
MRSDQLQRSCIIQPSVGALRLRWVTIENEDNSEGVVSRDGWEATLGVDEFVGRFP